VKENVLTSPNLDGAIFIDNLNKYWADAILQFPWEHVAWSLDGVHMLAHSPTSEGLIEEMNRLGIVDYVSDYLVPEGFCVGGPFLLEGTHEAVREPAT